MGIWPLDFLAEGYVSQNFQKKKWSAGGGGTQGRLLKGGGGGSYSRVEKKGGGVVHPGRWGKSNIFPKRGGHSTPPPPFTYGLGHMPGAQHIQPNLISLSFTYLITIIVNLIRALGLRIDYMSNVCDIYV